MSKYMDGTIHISIRVRKYSWKEFVYDVCYALYAMYMILDALSKRYLKSPVSGIFFRTHAAVSQLSISMSVVYKNSFLVILLVMFGIGGLLYTISIPVILFFVATGRIQ